MKKTAKKKNAPKASGRKTAKDLAVKPAKGGTVRGGAAGKKIHDEF